MTNRGERGEVRKYLPDRFFVNAKGERNFANGGTDKRERMRSVEVLKYTRTTALVVVEAVATTETDESTSPIEPVKEDPVFNTAFEYAAEAVVEPAATVIVTSTDLTFAETAPPAVAASCGVAITV